MTTAIIMALLLKYCTMFHVDYKVALAVVVTESNMNPKAISPGNDLGLFQLNPKSFPQYTQKQLLNPETNIKLGVNYLAKMQKECPHQDGLNWLVCYNYGIENAKKVKHPKLFPYVKKTTLNYRKICNI